MVVMKEVKMGMGRMRVKFSEERKKLRLLASCFESEEGLRVMIGRFAEICKERGLKVNADKSKMMVLEGEVGSI